MKNKFNKTLVFTIMLILCTLTAACGVKSVNESIKSADGTAKAEAVTKDSDKKVTGTISLKTLKTIPEFKCTDVNGKEVSSEIFKDSKITLINLWGTWCSPCVDELPDLGKLYEKVKDKGLNVVGVVEDGMKNEENVKKILDKSKITFTNIIPDERFYDDFVSLCGLYPASLLVDSSGQVVGELINGARTEDEYINLIEDALEKLKR